MGKKKEGMTLLKNVSVWGCLLRDCKLLMDIVDLIDISNKDFYHFLRCDEE